MKVKGYPCWNVDCAHGTIQLTRGSFNGEPALALFVKGSDEPVVLTVADWRSLYGTGLEVLTEAV